MINTAVDKPKIDLKKLRRTLSGAKNKQDLYQKIANGPFEQKLESAFLFLGLISFFLVDKDDTTVRLAAVSDTEQYNLSVSGYDFEPKDYELSLRADQDNDIIKAIQSGQLQETTDWESLSRRAADPEQARLNQASGGIAYSATYPLEGSIKGALLFCYFQYQENIGDLQKAFMSNYTHLVSDQLAKKI